MRVQVLGPASVARGEKASWIASGLMRDSAHGSSGKLMFGSAFEGVPCALGTWRVLECEAGDCPVGMRLMGVDASCFMLCIEADCFI